MHRWLIPRLRQRKIQGVPRSSRAGQQESIQTMMEKCPQDTEASSKRDPTGQTGHNLSIKTMQMNIYRKIPIPQDGKSKYDETHKWILH